MKTPGANYPKTRQERPGRRNIHSVGSVGKVEFVSSSKKYTGQFQGARHGILRIFLAREPNESVNNTAPFRVSHFSKFFEFHLPNPGSHSILYLNEESKFSEFSDFVYYSKISRQNGSDPLINEKKNCSDYRVHSIQIDRLGLMIST